MVAFGIPLMIERLFFGDELRPFLVALAASTVLYGALVHSFRRSLVLDHMRYSLRPRRSVRRRVIAE
jgi:hypothetical protein